MSYDVTWTADFASAPTGWTAVPNNGTVSFVGGSLRLVNDSADDHVWNSGNKDYTGGRVKLSDIDADGAELILAEISTTLIAIIGGWHYAGVGFWEDDENAYNVESTTDTGEVATLKVVANSFTGGSKTGAGAHAPLLLRIYANRTATKTFTIVNGDSLAAGKVRTYYSRDGGSTWVATAAAETLASDVDEVLIFSRTAQPLVSNTLDVDYLTITSTFSGNRPMTNTDTLKALLLDLYPPGAYPGAEDRNGDDTFHADICEMDASALAAAKTAADQLALEIFPQTAEETLDEWEIALAIDTVATAIATRQALCRDAASAARLVTPNNLRQMLAGLINPTYGWNDPGDADRLDLYDAQDGSGAVSESATGLVAGGASPAAMDFETFLDAHVTFPLVDRADGWTFEAEMQSITINVDTAAGIFMSPARNGQGDALFLGLEEAGAGVAIRAMLYTEASGNWSQLGTIATVGPPCWFQISRSASGIMQLKAGASLGAMASVVADLELTWTPRVIGVSTRNVAPWNTVTATWKPMRIAYERQHNNVQLYEYRADQIPADDTERIYWAFVYRDPTEAGAYDIAGAQRQCDRVKWGHSLILVGESNCFRCSDPYSLTSRDILSG